MADETRNPRRADTLVGKRMAMERILTAWAQMPNLRLGQLIENASHAPADPGAPFFYIEDFDLADQVERFVRENTRR